MLRSAPEIFQRKHKDGTYFCCSESFLRSWLHKTLHWSERRATRAAQKIPEDWNSICTKALLRIAYIIMFHDVPSELYVNTDQTQLVYSQGSSLTWTKSGAKQVPVIGEDKKRAFTLVVSVSNNGVLLPFQAVYQGHTSRSLPHTIAPRYDEAMAKKFQFVFLKTATYWSTLETMKSFALDVLHPYFEAEKKRRNLRDDQKCIWQIDIWSVHCSEPFREWMKEKLPYIIILYVLANCTAIFQLCDVGIQRILKHSLKHSYHRDIVHDITAQLEKGAEVKIEKKNWNTS